MSNGDFEYPERHTLERWIEILGDEKAAELFYNANKAHNVIDGNKRTSIILVYLFYLINDYMILSSFDIRTLAKRVAMSRGRQNHDHWIGKIEVAFSRHTARIHSESQLAT